MWCSHKDMCKKVAWFYGVGLRRGCVSILISMCTLINADHEYFQSVQITLIKDSGNIIFYVYDVMVLLQSGEGGFSDILHRAKYAIVLTFTTTKIVYQQSKSSQCHVAHESIHFSSTYE